VTVAQADTGRDLVLTFAGGGSITLKTTITHNENRIEQVLFADGTVWSHAELMTRSTAPNTGNDVFYGSFDGETLASGAGDDTVYAREGNDTLVGGTGNDTLSGDGGNDSYVYELGDGNDTIRDAGTGWGGGNDTIQLGAGILASQVTVAQADTGRDLVLTFAGGGSITLKTTITHNENRIEQVLFADGTVWSHAELMTFTNPPPTAAMYAGDALGF
jgi:Ca2+-binding RTX toxin-like protein